MAYNPQHPAEEAPIPGARILVVEAPYYEAIAVELRAGAMARLKAAGVEVEHIQVLGALEIPVAAAIALDAAAKAGKPFDGLVALGCVIRGETSHYDIVAGESARALMDLGVARKLPVGNGILTVDTEAQAKKRASRAEGDKGGVAAAATLALVRLARAKAG
ncbi:MAG: 6,7-dimethyl-8-ribityllumazine synthase [Bradyrhizobiaceae bacterium]|nr:6,7-dimethyl-8-ribityllumazine synthase [Bradyrhizobiaceae bacterium]